MKIREIYDTYLTREDIKLLIVNQVYFNGIPNNID